MDCRRSLTDGVVQTKGFVSPTPSIADPTAPLENQGGYTEVLQASGRDQTIVSSTDDDNIRLRVRKVDFAFPFLQPFPVVREGVPEFSRRFWVVFQTAQTRVHGVTLPLSVRGGDQAENTRSESEVSHLEGENALYPSNPRGEVHQGSISEVERCQIRDLESIVQELFDARAATEGAKIPSDGKDISPKAIIDEKVDNFCCLSGLNEGRESGMPLAGDLSHVEIFR